MKTLLEYVSLVVIAIMIMPLLVEPTPLTLWLGPDDKAPTRIDAMRVGGQEEIRETALRLSGR